MTALPTPLTPERIEALFTRDGQYLCARWGRPVAPVIFGLGDDSLNLFRSVLGAACAHARVPMTEADPEMGANLMLFFCREWDELSALPDLDRLTGQPDLPQRLQAQSADHYQIMRFESRGAIRACLSFARMSGPLGQLHPAVLAETLAMRALLSFAVEITPSPDLAALIRAAYDPVLPDAARDPSHALRLAARMAQG